MIQNLTDFLARIDQMKIYEQDYPIIQKMFELPPNLYMKLLEEILDGQLYFADLEPIFKDDGYTDLLKIELGEQHKLLNKMKNLSTYRSSVFGSTGYSNMYNNEGFIKVDISESDEERFEYLMGIYFNPVDGKIQKPSSTKLNLKYLKTLNTTNDPELQELVDLADKIISSKLYEYFRVDRRDALLFSLMNMNDSDILKGYKNRLFQMISTNEWMKTQENVEIIQDPETGKNSVIYTVDNTEREFIDVDSLLFSADDAVIPVNYKHQTLNADDLNFMQINNIPSDEMKKMKMFYKILVRDKFMEDELEIN